MKKCLFAIPVLAFCFALAACAGDHQTSCLQRAAALEVSITQSYQSTATLYKASLINKTTAQEAVKITDSANTLVDSGEKLCQSDQPTALQYLANVQVMLDQVAKLTGEK